jgi:probable non-F420 flavinoid oxidoreductase
VVVLGFHASHEQVGPAALRDAVVRAEQVGFGEAMCSDHLSPWSHAQGESAFAFAWLGAALQAGTRMRIGQFHAPGQRYHPVLSAQAAATLAAMFPGRYQWMAVGSGEYLNEHVTGQGWPVKPVRNARLLESVEIMRALWRGEEVTHAGLVTVDRARVWTLPPHDIALLAGAVSVETATWAAGWADGLVTVNQPPDQLRRVVAGYRDAGGTGPLALQIHLSYDPDPEKAMAIAMEQWRSNCVPASLAWELALPDQFEAATRFVPEAEVARAVHVCAEPDALVDLLAQYADLGFERLYLHHVGVEQEAFLEMAGSHLLPALQGSGS